MEGLEILSTPTSMIQLPPLPRKNNHRGIVGNANIICEIGVVIVIIDYE